MRLFFLCFFIINSVHAQKYDAYYTSYIYDQSDLSYPPSDQEVLESLKNKKRHEIDLFVLNPLRKELLEKKNNLKFYHWKRFFFSGLYEVVTAFSKNPNDFCVFDSYGERRKYQILEDAIPVHSLEADIIQMENKIQVIENQMDNDLLNPVEQIYVCKKPNLPEPFQQRIENKLLELHQSEQSQKLDPSGIEFIQSLISHPTKHQFLSEKAEGYIEALEKSINLMGKFKGGSSIQGEAERLLTQIIEANEDGKRFFAYCDIKKLDESEFCLIAQRIAKSLDLPFYVIDAAQAMIDEGFLQGNKEKKGLVLDVLQTPNTSGHSFLNPILIIKNMDHWMKTDYMSWVLKLFDNSPEKFYSSYFDLYIDWGKMHIICSGTPSHDELEPAFNSRTVPFVFEAN